ncbi:hypothetical protein D910_04065, partial [Dendroctonus ponderosae]
WFCHFDDDNYVNVPRLVRFLADYNPREDWYLGKPSIQAPLEIVSKDKKSVSFANPIFPQTALGGEMERAGAICGVAGEAPGLMGRTWYLRRTVWPPGGTLGGQQVNPGGVVFALDAKCDASTDGAVLVRDGRCRVLSEPRPRPEDDAAGKQQWFRGSSRPQSLLCRLFYGPVGVGTGLCMHRRALGFLPHDLQGTRALISSHNLPKSGRYFAFSQLGNIWAACSSFGKQRELPPVSGPSPFWGAGSPRPSPPKLHITPPPLYRVAQCWPSSGGQKAPIYPGNALFGRHRGEFGRKIALNLPNSGCHFFPLRPKFHPEKPTSLAGIDGKFISIGERIRLPDDVTMGYIIEHLIKKPLTVIDEFHSHLEPMKFIRKDLIEQQANLVQLRQAEGGVERGAHRRHRREIRPEQVPVAALLPVSALQLLPESPEKIARPESTSDQPTSAYL